MPDSTCMNQRIPIVTFVFAVLGLIGLSWLSVREIDHASDQQALAEELLQRQVHLLGRLTELEAQKVVTSVRYKEVEVAVPRTEYRATRGVGPFTSKVPYVIMERQLIKVPEEIKSEDPIVLQEIKKAQNDIGATREEIEKVEFAETLTQQLIGIRREIAAFIFSAVIMGVSLFVIMNKKFRANAEKWAYGSIGTIMGYWLA